MNELMEGFDDIPQLMRKFQDHDDGIHDIQ